MSSEEKNIKEVRRTIRPKTHGDNSPYRVKIGEKAFYDKLFVYVDHESKDFKLTFIFEGREIAPFESIHFKAREVGDKTVIEWVQKLKFKILEQ